MTGHALKIECFFAHGCSSEDTLMRNLGEALRLEGVCGSEVVCHRVDEAVARALGLRGSPTVLIDGQDIEQAGAEMDGFG